MLVASRYSPHQYLIGPSMFPFWFIAMRTMLIVVGLVYVVLAGVGFFVQGKLVQTFIQSTNGFFNTALFWAAVVTLVFWFFERNQVRFGFLNNWQPEKLAAQRNDMQVKRTDSLFELVIGVLFVVWWWGALSFPASFSHHGKAVEFAISSAWAPYWWGILSLGIVGVALSIADLISPQWRWERLLLRILLNIASIYVVYLLYQQNVLIVVGDGNVEIGKYGNAQVRLNELIKGLFAVLAVIWSYDIFQDLRRLLRLRKA
jgi:hypothetical protein